MTKHEIVRAWKDPKLRAAAGVATPAGERASEAELKNVAGAGTSGAGGAWIGPDPNGAGWFSSISGECWGFSCNPF